MNLIKIPFFVTNLIFLILSLGLIASSIVLLSDETIVDRIISFSNLTQILKQYNSTSEQNVLASVTDPISYLTLCVGGLLFGLSFLGCCGALKDSRILVAAFGVFLFLLILAEIGGIVLYFFVFKPDIKSYLSSGISQHYNADPSLRPLSAPGNKFTILLDYLMMSHHCCGISGPMDFTPIYDAYHNSQFSDKGRLQPEKEFQTVPEACCKLNFTWAEVNEIYEGILDNDDKNFDRSRKELLKYGENPRCISGLEHFKEFAYIGDDAGCYDKIQVDWKRVVVIVGVVLGLIQSVGVVFAVFVFKAAYYDYHE